VNGLNLKSNTNMKVDLTNQTVAAVVRLVVIALAILTAGLAPAAESARGAKRAAGPPVIDPSTGLPVHPLPDWIDPDWKDPDKVLAEVNYDALPLNVVVEHLRNEFKGAFDILIPNGWQDPNTPGLSIDPQSATIKMQLKNVTASELFHAMNLLFEAENSPYRWELKMNGNRPTAMLRILPRLLHVPDPPPPVLPKTRMVYFVGDLIGEEKPGGMPIERLVKTVSEVYEMSFAHSNAKNVIQYHKDAQLLVVTGNSDETAFVQQTLSALRGKAQAERPPPRAVEPKGKAEDKKAP
jgi:hypothetical protein